MFPYEEAIPIALDFAQEMSRNHGMDLKEFSPGGGFAVRYLIDQAPPSAGQRQAGDAALARGQRSRL